MNNWPARRDRFVAFFETEPNLLLIMCLLFAAFVGLAIHGRGPFRRATYYKGPADVLSMYVQAKAWVAGLDPYSEESRLTVWPKEVYSPHPISIEYLDERAAPPIPYFIFSFVPLTPLAVLPWPIASAFLLFLDFVFLFVVLKALANYSKLAGLGRLVWFAAGLLFAPVYAGMDSNNIAVLAAELAMLAFSIAQRRDTLGALLLAVSLALKPQIGFCFLVYFVWTRCWRVAAKAVAFVMATVAIAVVRMYWVHVTWLPNYLRAGPLFFHAGGVNDFRPQNFYSFDMVNLQVILYRLLGSERAAQLLAFGIATLLFLVWWWLFHKMEGSPRLLAMGSLGAISLLPVYHRFYDATLLLVAVCWYVSKFSIEKTSHLYSLALWAPFFVPVASLLRWWAANHNPQNWFLGIFVRSAANCCLLGLTIFLLASLTPLHWARQCD